MPVGGGKDRLVFDKKPKCLNSQINGKQPSLKNRIYSDKEISCAVTTAPFFMPNYLINKKGDSE